MDSECGGGVGVVGVGNGVGGMDKDESEDLNLGESGALGEQLTFKWWWCEWVWVLGCSDDWTTDVAQLVVLFPCINWPNPNLDVLRFNIGADTWRL